MIVEADALHIGWSFLRRVMGAANVLQHRSVIADKQLTEDHARTAKKALGLMNARGDFHKNFLSYLTPVSLYSTPLLQNGQGVGG